MNLSENFNFRRLSKYSTTNPEYQKARNIIILVIIIANDGNETMKKVRVVETDFAIFQA